MEGSCACSRANPRSLEVFSAPCYQRTIGSPASWYDAYIVLPCNTDISSEFQLPKGRKFSLLACVSLDRALEETVQIHLSIPSVSSHRAHQKRRMILKSHCKSFLCHLLYLSILFVLFTRDGLNGQQPRLEGDGQFLSRHTLDKDCSPQLALFTSIRHKYHRKSTPIHS